MYVTAPIIHKHMILMISCDEKMDTHLRVVCRKLLGEGLGTSTIDELVQIEQQLERSVRIIRARKV